MRTLIEPIDWQSVTTFVAVIWSVWFLVGFGKERGALLEGDARKINHFLVLVGGVVWFRSASPMVDRVSCHVACGILFVSLLLVCRFPHHRLCRLAFLGYARDSDRPHAAFHVWFSWLVSLVGLELVDRLFGSIETTRLATLVLGIADALAEPIGRRFGRHRYQVYGILAPQGSTRSWEGSLAVALSTAIIMILSGRLLSGMAWPILIVEGVVIGLFVAIIEAWTPHGLDNFTIPISTACIVQVLTGIWGTASEFACCAE